MIGLNLHDIVRPMIEAVHPDEDAVLYQANGQVNKLGVVKPLYLAPQNVRVNFQPLDADTLKHLEAIGDTKAGGQVFMYVNPDFPVMGTSREPVLRTGDFIQRKDNTWYLITSVIEDWYERGWCNAGVTQQITPPDFSGCDWFPMPLGGDANA